MVRDSLYTAKRWESLRRIIDFCVAAVLLLLLGIPFLYIAWRIRQDSPGPVFFPQKRMKHGGETFWMLKFRTMKVDADDRLVQNEDLDERITPIGHTLRRLKFDELPQLLNILKGDMAIIGPRPMMESLYLKREKELPQYAERLSVRQGLAGWAALQGPEEKLPNGFRTQLELDRYYIEHMSPSLDWSIILGTVGLLSRSAARIPGFDLKSIEAAE